MALSNVYPSLRDRVVLITGGATGIGASLVEAFCRQRARVAFLDIEDEAAALLVRRLAGIEGATPARYYRCDLRDIEALRKAAKAVREEIGPVGVLVNNAASDARHDFRELSVDAWNERINVNLRHPFFAIQAVYEQMKSQGGGSIINFGSISWHRNSGGMPAYTTAKAAVEGLTKGMARDLGPYGIRVNTVIPGWVMTERQIDLWLTPAAEAELMANQCIPSRVLPEDVARLVLWLAADDSRMCTSQLWVCDGGWM